MTTSQRLSESIRRDSKRAAAFARSAIAGLAVCARKSALEILPSLDLPNPQGIGGIGLPKEGRFAPLRT